MKPFLLHAEESRGTGQPGDVIGTETIDPKVLPLVELLDSFEGVAPFSSCQGHSKGEHLIACPFVSFEADIAHARRVHAAIERLYANNRLKLLWHVVGDFSAGDLMWVMRPTTLSINRQQEGRPRSLSALLRSNDPMNWRALFDHDLATLTSNFRVDLRLPRPSPA
ncbi:hypothetical protein J7355_15490 [Endozoicomonas sp. G2_2]|uniref:hypothetical protein n=1 Tax=Endozoicomonas sp. G2_2 TaxID=2821092 RepID=UPI001AD99B14|nr:hypothetical protein [Endozoicomonas sp. G2_2]MBO9471492.1 hypothetical protein [Endozoicomonas sp. G2_2]